MMLNLFFSVTLRILPVEGVRRCMLIRSGAQLGQWGPPRHDSRDDQETQN